MHQRVVDHYEAHATGLLESEAALLFRQMVEAVKHVHDNGWAHNDIKLENFFLRCRPSASPLVVLADFEYALPLDGIARLRLKRTCAAPEGILGDGPYDMAKADVWSLGVCLAALLTCRVVTLDPRGRRVKWSQSHVPGRSAALDDLMNQLLRWDPASRIDVDDILRHPWLRGGEGEGEGGGGGSLGGGRR